MWSKTNLLQLQRFASSNFRGCKVHVAIVTKATPLESKQPNKAVKKKNTVAMKVIGKGSKKAATRVVAQATDKVAKANETSHPLCLRDADACEEGKKLQLMQIAPRSNAWKGSQIPPIATAFLDLRTRIWQATGIAQTGLPELKRARNENQYKKLFVLTKALSSCTMNLFYV